MLAKYDYLEVQGEDDIFCCWECIDKVLEIMA